MVFAAPVAVFRRDGKNTFVTAVLKVMRISPSSISTAVVEIEASFGVQPFIRHHASGLSMTQAERELLAKTRDLLRNAEELQITALRIIQACQALQRIELRHPTTH